MDVNKRLSQIEVSVSDGLKLLDKQAVKLEKLLNRTDFSIKRLVRTEGRLERNEQRLQAMDARVEAGEKSMKALYVLIDQSRKEVALNVASLEKKMLELDKRHAKESRRLDKVINTQGRLTTVS